MDYLQTPQFHLCTLTPKNQFVRLHKFHTMVQLYVAGVFVLWNETDAGG